MNRMLGLMGIIYVGGVTEAVRNETRDKIVDALNACKAALDKGVLPGGGAALLHAAKSITPKLVALANSDQRRGAEIVRLAANVPIRLILHNAGLNSKKLYREVEAFKDPWMGYDIQTSIMHAGIMGVEKVENMWAAGIWDSLKVVQTYLKDAISIAGLVMSTECIAVRKKSYTRMLRVY